MCEIPCFHGDCIGYPNYNQTCDCHYGWYEDACDVPLCDIPSGKGCLHGGVCIEPNICHCALGWTGINCDEVQLVEPAPLFLILSFITISFAAWSLGRWVSKKMPEVPIPKITLYLFVGILCGPYLCQMITLTAIRELGFVSRACLGFLSAMAGSELSVPLLRETGRAVIYIVTIVVVGCFSFVLLITYSINPIITWMHSSENILSSVMSQSMNSSQIFLVCVMFATLSLAVAPTANIAVIFGMKATGKWCSLTMSVTVIIEIISLVLFSLSEAITKNEFDVQSGSQLNTTSLVINKETLTSNNDTMYIIGIFCVRFIVSIIVGTILAFLILLLSWPFSFYNSSQSDYEEYDSILTEQNDNNDNDSSGIIYKEEDNSECHDNSSKATTFYELSRVDIMSVTRHIKKWFYNTQSLRIIRHIYRTILILFISWIIFFLSDYAMFHNWLEPLLILASMGFVISNFTYYGDSFKRLLYGVAPLVFSCFFTLIGASMNIELIFTGISSLIALIIFLGRFIAMYFSSYIACKFTNQTEQITSWFYTSLIIQAGLALGLSSHVALTFPIFGYNFNTIIACLVIFSQVFGPLLIRIAVRAVGEDNQIGNISPEVIKKLHNTINLSNCNIKKAKVHANDSTSSSEVYMTSQNESNDNIDISTNDHSIQHTNGLNTPLLTDSTQGIHNESTNYDYENNTYDPISWLRPGTVCRGTIRHIQSTDININNNISQSQDQSQSKNHLNQSQRLQQIYNNLRNKRQHRVSKKQKKEELDLERDDFGTL